MNILYHHRVGSKDGQAVHISALIEALRGLGHTVTVVEPPSFRQTGFGSSSSSLTWLKRHVPRQLYELLELGYNVVDYARLRRAFLRTAPDILYERYNLFTLAGIWLSYRTSTPLLLEINSPLAYERETFGGLALRNLAVRLEASTWRRANHVLPVTQVLAQMVLDVGVSASRVTVVPNGVDLTKFADIDSAAAKQTLGLADKTVMGFVGFIREWHGLDRIVDFLSRPETSPSLHLLLVGDGPALPMLRDQARAIGVMSRITFTGLVDHDDIGRHIAAFDIALQPRVVDYASPLKIFEYMALGKAIVAPDQPNIREILTDGRNALLINPEAPDAMANAVMRLADDTALRARLGENARATLAERKLSWVENACRVALIGEELIARHVRDHSR